MVLKNIKSIFFSIFILMMTYPIQSFAHEGEEHQETASFSFIDYSMIAVGVMAVIAIIIVIILNQKRKSINVKTKEGQVKSRQFQKWMKVSQWIAVIAIVVLLITGAATFFTKDNVNTGSVELTHIHGLGFTKDGSEIYVPAHDGLKVFSNGQWSEAAGEKHDYMGFSMVDDGFYSSGHPAPDSSMKNPFGIVRSTNMGEDLKTLGLYGEIDFHGMDVGYNNHAIYVFNPKENSQMDDTGIYYSLDDTKTWNKSGMKGIKGQVSAIAVHPDQEEVIAVSTNQGIFLSKDSGDTFEELSDVPTSALSFSNQGKLYAGSVSSKVELTQINTENGEKSSLPLPSIKEEDAISYIAINPQNEQHIVISTFNKDIFSTGDRGESWSPLVDEGKSVTQHKEEVTSSSQESETSAGDSHAKDHSGMKMSGSSDVPENLQVAESPKYPVGSKAISQASHMGGMMENVEVTIVGAYDTTAYATTYTNPHGELVKEHKWIVQEEFVDGGEELLKPGTKINTTAEHMNGMKEAIQTIDFSETTTVYMVDFTTADGHEVTNHKWVTEDELKPL
jgi:Protein of unknown function (DUF1541)